MSTKKKVTFIGLWIFLAIVAAYFGISYLKGLDIFSDSYKYYVKFGNISALTVASPVMINGFKVGTVSDMEFDASNGGSTLVELNVKKKYKLPKNSDAIIKPGLISGAEVAIQLGSSDIYLQKGDTLFSSKPAPDYIEMLNNEVIPAIKHLLPKADSILSAWNRISNDPSIPATLKEANRAATEARIAMANISGSSEKIRQFSEKDIPELSAHLKKFADNVAAASSSLDSTQLANILANLEKSSFQLKELSKRLTDPDNSVGKLFTDKDLYQRVDSLLTTTEALIEDIKAHPKRYLKISVF